MFKQFRQGGVTYLAVERGSNVHVIDDQGNNYGGWSSVDSFRKSLRGEKTVMGHSPLPVEILGQCKLVVRVLE